ncbi:DUF4390 domain-containing protein [Paucibacter sp. AS339]|uniref:DUF4390 domain-containing protein n=1 Tax=Paucibacter hankyongi TaxID=3133434 RepID=UPI00309EC6D9
MSCRLVQGLALLLLSVLMLVLPVGTARAEGVELNQVSSARVEEGLELSFSTRFELPRAAEEALMKGVPIYFVAEAAVLRNRWYWRDARAARVSRTWRLAWQPLTRQFKVSTGGLNQSYASLAEALVALRGVSGWRIAEPKDIEDEGRYYVEFSYRLDTSQLPRPMQIGLGSPQGWGLNLERNLSLNPDFSIRGAGGQ